MDSNKKKCPYCGEEIMADAKKCRHCGEWLDKPSESKPVDKTPSVGKTNSKKTWFYVAIAAVIVVVGVVAAIYTSKSDGNSNNDNTPKKQIIANAEDYSIQQVSFDAKTLVGLNLMERKDAIKILESNGWISAMQTTDENGSVVADGYIQDNDDLSVYTSIFAYLPNQSNVQRGEGFIEFATNSETSFKAFEQSLVEKGYKVSIDPSGEEQRIAPEDQTTRYFVYKKVGDDNSPVIGLITKNESEETDYTLYVKKSPSNISK